MNVCFVAHFAYGALTESTAGHIGGVERQTALMARWLAGQGHQVSVVTWSEGPAGDETIDGVRVIKACRRDAGLPGVRFLHPRWTSLNQAMARADADLYYQNCAESVTGQVALWARRNGRKFVFSVASDPECDPALEILGSVRERWLYRYGLRAADAVLVQTRAQTEALADGFGIESAVHPMPCRVAHDHDVETLLACRSPQPRVLWIGRLMPVKNLDRLFAVAERLPDVHFDVVGGVDQDTAYAERVLTRGEELANVTMHGRLASGCIAKLLMQSWMLLCTSDHEGFPNTFLESWGHARPVVTTVDPDGLIQELDLGVAAANDEALARAISAYRASPERLDAHSRGAHRYFEQHHTVQQAMSRFETTFQTVLG